MTTNDDYDVVGVSISQAATRITRGASYVYNDDDDSDLSPQQDDVREWPRASDEYSHSPDPEPRSPLPSKSDETQSQSVTRTEPPLTQQHNTTRSALKEALAAETRHRRSSSWGHGDLKRYLHSLPSLSSVSNLMSNLSHHGSHQQQKTTSIQQRPDTTTEPKNRPHVLRRVTSDHALLYMSLSRSSSLGDDSRWLEHHDMVNSRVKAIRDSLHDRSSFRMPSMPSFPNLPSMPASPTFRKALNYLNPRSPDPQPSENVHADTTKERLPGMTRRTSETSIEAIVGPGVVAATPAVPKPVKKVVDAVADPSLIDAFESVLPELIGDVVILGGYRGSILRSAKPPHRQLWVPVKVGLNIRKVDLEVGLEPEDEERMEETIFADGMLSHIGPIDISRRLLRRLRDSENAKNGTLRIHDYGWDWRLSPALHSKRFEAFLSALPCNSTESGKKSAGALVIAHSLGGLITRHVVNRRPELFSGVVYAGTPQACVNILGPIRNGDAVLMSQRVLTAQVNFTLRTSFALLPLEGYCFEDKHTGKKYSVDFFDVNDWIKYRFSPVIDPPLPPKQQLPPSGISGLLKNTSLTNLTMLKSKKEATLPSNPTTAPHQSTEDSSTTTKAKETLETLTPPGTSLQPTTNSSQPSPPITTTIPRDAALKYLSRTLAEIKAFKQALAHLPALESANRYPPFAIIYGKETPTVKSARVDGRDAIACSDCYDDLGFGSGDGVVLAREAQLPEGYRVVVGGQVESRRGHVGLLGDLAGVGRAVGAVLRGRRRGIGSGDVEGGGRGEDGD